MLNDFSVNISMTAYVNGHVKTAYLSDYKVNDIFTFYDLDISFKIVDLTEDSMVIELVDGSDKYELTENYLNLGEETEVINSQDDFLTVTIRIDSIK